MLDPLEYGEPPVDEPEPEEWDPGDEVDEEGGMSEHKHLPMGDHDA